MMDKKMELALAYANEQDITGLIGALYDAVPKPWEEDPSGYPKEILEKITERTKGVYLEVMDDIGEKIRTRMAETFAERLSEDELKQMVQWVRSPVSKKMYQLTQDIYPDLMGMVISTTDKVEKRLTDELDKILREAEAQSQGLH